MVYRKQETDNGASGIYSDSFRDTLVFLSLGSPSLEELFQQQPRPTDALIPSRLQNEHAQKGGDGQDGSKDQFQFCYTE